MCSSLSWRNKRELDAGRRWLALDPDAFESECRSCGTVHNQAHDVLCTVPLDHNVRPWIKSSTVYVCSRHMALLLGQEQEPCSEGSSDMPGGPRYCFGVRSSCGDLFAEKVTVEAGMTTANVAVRANACGVRDGVAYRHTRL